MQLVLLGAPGSGKGTQGIVLARHFDVIHVSSGDLLRRHVKAHSDLGRRVSGFVARGELVPDELVLDIVGDALIGAVAAGGYVLDGIPRTLSQAKLAFELAKPVGGVDADAVISLEVPDAVARSRLALRAAAGRADDANAAVIERRLEQFRADTGPLLDYYRERDLLVAIDGSMPADAVSAAIFDALDRRGIHG
jgi:adenylate kinase